MGYPCFQTASHHLLCYFLFLSCTLILAQRFPGQSQTKSLASHLGWPEPRQPLPTAGSESCFSLHSHLFAFNILLLSKFLLRLSVDFSVQRVFLLSVQSDMRNSIDSSKMWPKMSAGDVSPLNNHQFCSSLTSSSHSALQSWSVWLSLLYRIGECGKLSCLKNQICSPSGNLFTSLCKWYSSNSVFLCSLNWTGWGVWLVTRCH